MICGREVGETTTTCDEMVKIALQLANPAARVEVDFEVQILRDLCPNILPWKPALGVHVDPSPGRPAVLGGIRAVILELTDVML